MIIDIEGLNHQGEGVGRIDGLVYFVPGAVPGDRLEIEETGKHRSYRRGRIIKVLEPSPDRIDEDCPLRAECGGCGLPPMRYEAELRWKQRLVRDALQRLAGLEDIVVRPVIGMAEPRRYRNKAVFHREPETGRFGFYAAGTHRVLSMEDCLLVPREWLGILCELEAFLAGDGNGANHVKGATLRRSLNSGEVMLVLETDRPVQETTALKLCGIMLQAHPGLQTIAAVCGQQVRVLAGSGFIEEKLLDNVYRISPTAFFQVNTVMACNMVQEVLDWVGNLQGKTVIDAYCGIGTFALPAARKADRVIGIESHLPAVEDARQNAHLNGLTSTVFLPGRAEEIIGRLLDGGESCDLLIVDPPRQGLDEAVIKALESREIPQIIYISCHTGTLARDLKRLHQIGYHIERVQPFDMFPRTPHVECAVFVAPGRQTT